MVIFFNNGTVFYWLENNPGLDGQVTRAFMLTAGMGSRAAHHL